MEHVVLKSLLFTEVSLVPLSFTPMIITTNKKNTIFFPFYGIKTEAGRLSKLSKITQQIKVELGLNPCISSLEAMFLITALHNLFYFVLLLFCVPEVVHIF